MRYTLELLGILDLFLNGMLGSKLNGRIGRCLRCVVVSS